jgi:MFS family permease
MAVEQVLDSARPAPDAELMDVNASSSAPRSAQRSIVGTLTAATAVGSIGLAAGGLAGALLATDMTGSEATAGLPIGLLVAGSAVSAVLLSALSARTSRRTGLAAGYTIGAVGAAVVIIAAQVHSFAALLVGSTVLGAANIAVFLARYAAAAASIPAARARNLGTVMFGAAVGAVASPLLLGPSEHLAAALSLPRYTGLYLIAVLAFSAAASMCATIRTTSSSHQLLRRPPLPAPSWRSMTTTRTVGAALGILAITNLVMVAIMAIAPVHLSGHGHGLDTVGFVVAAHVFCMFAPAPMAGMLTDRFGATRVAVSGGILLVAAAGISAGGDPHSAVAMTAGLLLLGIGWSAGIVAGSAMLAASAPAREQMRTEGLGEAAMGAAAAAGAPVAGALAANGGFAALSAAGACAAVLVVAVAVIMGK